MKFEVEVDYDNATPIMPTLNDFKGIVTEQMKESITQIKAVLESI